MKNILFLLACIIIFSAAKAQTFQMTGGYVAGDTVVNTAVKTCSLKVSKNYLSVSIAAEVTKISGTLAGTITLQGSVDGVNYATVDTNAVLNGLSTYTVTNTSGTQTKVWLISGNPYLYYQLSYTGSGTMAALIKGYLLPRGTY